MSKEQTKSIRTESTNYDTRNSGRPSTASHINYYSMATHCLPSWQKFAEGTLIFPRSYENYKRMNFEGSNYQRHLPILLESPNLIFRSQKYVLPLPAAIYQQVPFQFHQFMPSVHSSNLGEMLLPEAIDPVMVSQKFPPAPKIVQNCHLCGCGISRDLARHMRTHNRQSRFKCFYPRVSCHHKTGYFRRKYDLKKHLLRRHFVLQNGNVKRLKNLTGELEKEGTCPCGKTMKAREWLIHIIARDSDGSLECEDLKNKIDDAKVNICESKLKLSPEQ